MARRAGLVDRRHDRRIPEAALARELALCYTPLALVTDLDAGVEGGEGVTHEEVLRVFAENVDRLRDLLVDALAALPGRTRLPVPARARRPELPFDLP